MICYLAPVAVGTPALWTVMSPHIFLLIAREEVVAVLSGAIEIITWVAGISDHFPLKPLHFGNFFLSQELFEVNFGGERHPAVHVRAHYRNFALVNLGPRVLAQALAVIDIVRSTNGVQINVAVVKERHEADLASLVFFVLRMSKQVLSFDFTKSSFEL